jgi:uncharacterized protein YigA (DUF484 family)
MAEERPAGLAGMTARECRYDVLPPWAWRRERSAIERLEAKIAMMESLVRENDRALADNLARIARLTARHRRNKVEFARALDRHRVALAGLRQTAGENGHGV